MKPAQVQNTAVQPSWSQLWRELRCAVLGCMFYVGSGGYYRGMPQSHCYRCGRKGPSANQGCTEWEPPIG